MSLKLPPDYDSWRLAGDDSLIAEDEEFARCDACGEYTDDFKTRGIGDDSLTFCEACSDDPR